MNTERTVEEMEIDVDGHFLKCSEKLETDKGNSLYRGECELQGIDPDLPKLKRLFAFALAVGEDAGTTDVASLRRDAERWRKLRDGCLNLAVVPLLAAKDRDLVMFTGQSLDVAADANNDPREVVATQIAEQFAKNTNSLSKMLDHLQSSEESVDWPEQRQRNRLDAAIDAIE